jgi:hypothetical protein
VRPQAVLRARATDLRRADVGTAATSGGGETVDSPVSMPPTADAVNRVESAVRRRLPARRRQLLNAGTTCSPTPMTADCAVLDAA